MAEERHPPFFYGYVIGALGFFIQSVFWGTYRSFGLFFNPLLNEFGWTRAELSTAASIGWLLIGFMNIPTGALTDRFGPRITLTACGFFFGLGYIFLWQLHALWQLYLFYGFIIAIGMSGADIIPLSTIARWFATKRGTFTGISKIGTGLGMMAMPLLAGPAHHRLRLALCLRHTRDSRPCHTRRYGPVPAARPVTHGPAALRSAPP